MPLSFSRNSGKRGVQSARSVTNHRPRKARRVQARRVQPLPLARADVYIRNKGKPLDACRCAATLHRQPQALRNFAGGVIRHSSSLRCRRT